MPVTAYLPAATTRSETQPLPFPGNVSVAVLPATLIVQQVPVARFHVRHATHCEHVDVLHVPVEVPFGRNQPDLATWKPLSRSLLFRVEHSCRSLRDAPTPATFH